MTYSRKVSLVSTIGHKVYLLQMVFCQYIFWPRCDITYLSGVCEQHRRRPACASAQTDQRLCYSLCGKYNIQTCYMRNFNILASLCSWGYWFESRSVGNLEDRFCRDETHLWIAYFLHVYLRLIEHHLGEQNAPSQDNIFCHTGLIGTW